MGSREILAGKAVVELGLRNKIQAGLKGAQAQLRTFASSASVIGSALAAGGAAVGGALAWPIKLAADMEQTATSFEVLLGSADAARKMLGDLEQMAVRTPFTTTSLSDAAKTLMNFGVAGNEVLPLLSALGDASGGVDERFQRLALAFGQANAKGRLMGQEVLQMVEAGFNPLQEISRTTGISVATLSKQMEAGQISIGMLKRAFATATGPGGRFFGMMAKQSQAAWGLWSTLLDSAQIAARGIGDALLPAIKLVLRGVIALVDPIGQWVERNRQLVQIIAAIAAAAAVAGGAILALSGIAYAALTMFGLVSAGITAITAALAIITSPLGLVAIGIIAAATAAYQFRDSLLAWLPAFEGVKAYAVQAFGSIANAIQAGRWDLAGAIMLAKLRLLFASTVGGLSDIWAAFGVGFMAVWDNVTNSVGNAWRTVVNYVFGTFDTIYTFISQMGVLISKVFGVTEAQARSAIEGLQADFDARAKARGQAPVSDNAGRERARMAAASATMLANAQAEQAIRDQIAALEKEAATAAENAPTLTKQASDAWAALKQSILDAGKAPEASPQTRQLQAAAAGGVATTSKLASTGTFSGAAAALLGLSGKPDERTAKNTEAMRAILLRMERKRTQSGVFV